LSHDSLKQAAMLHHHSPRSDTEMGDDFAALDASLLLDDFNIQDGYQGVSFVF
jgi:hypothetical protein